jgi:hypothetical protein
MFRHLICRVLPMLWRRDIPKKSSPIIQSATGLSYRLHPCTILDAVIIQEGVVRWKKRDGTRTKSMIEVQSKGGFYIRWMDGTGKRVEYEGEWSWNVPLYNSRGWLTRMCSFSAGSQMVQSGQLQLNLQQSKLPCLQPAVLRVFLVHLCMCSEEGELENLSSWAFDNSSH